MPKYLIRIEAVNLDNFILDTQDISTMRGGGLLLLDAPGHAPPEVHEGKIYVGASTGLFVVEIPPTQDVGAYCETIRSVLQSGDRQDATFVVDCCPYEEGQFPRSHALATAGNRWSQLQSPTLVPPPPGTVPCSMDRIRPASTRILRKAAALVDREEDRYVRVSEAVATRREYGIKQKFGFYQKHAPGLEYAEFTNDLDEISDYPAAGKLHGKIALIYLDGNGFGRILRACRDEPTLQRWSDLQHYNRDQFLAWFLSIPGQLQAARKSGMTEWLWCGNDNNGRWKENLFRLETLLWGGDEIIWAVPAWTGWWVLQMFFELYGRLGSLAALEFDPDGEIARPLTHSAALVFCHHNAPIHRVIDLAKELTDPPKETIKKSGVVRNYCAYQVLESFDHLGRSPNLWRRAFVAPLGVDETALLLDGSDMGRAHEAIAKLKTAVARSRLHEVLAGIYRDKNVTASLRLGRQALERANKDVPGTEETFHTLGELSARSVSGATSEMREAIAWLHAGELWDYVQPITWQTPPKPPKG